MLSGEIARPLARDSADFPLFSSLKRIVRGEGRARSDERVRASEDGTGRLVEAVTRVSSLRLQLTTLAPSGVHFLRLSRGLLRVAASTIFLTPAAVCLHCMRVSYTSPLFPHTNRAPGRISTKCPDIEFRSHASRQV